MQQAKNSEKLLFKSTASKTCEMKFSSNLYTLNSEVEHHSYSFANSTYKNQQLLHTALLYKTTPRDVLTTCSAAPTDPNCVFSKPAKICKITDLLCNPPPPGFTHVFTKSDDSDSKPSAKGLKKRQERGAFSDEFVTKVRYTGVMKFYQTKKRFGFICLDHDHTDVFLCEDDLILSGINLKFFKEQVKAYKPMRFSFLLKFYLEEGKPKRKAVDLVLRPC
jgi:hypothetical protein